MSSLLFNSRYLFIILCSIVCLDHPKNEKPVIRDYAQNHTVSEGGNKTLSCEILDFSDPTTPVILEWVKHVKVNGSYMGDERDEQGKLYTQIILVSLA